MSQLQQHSTAKVSPPVNPDEPVTILLLGGGVRYPALIGALSAVEQKGLKVGKIVGSSSGSIVGAMYALGMSAAELREEALALDTARFRDVSLSSILFNKGLCAGNVLERWVDERLGGLRFGDNFKIPVQVIATDILNYRPVIFSSASHPDLKVATAARYSIGVPWVFATRRLIHQGKEQVLVDGSLMAGSVEESYGRNERVLILKVVSTRSRRHAAEHKLTLGNYFRETINFFLHAMEKEFIKGGRWKDTILLYCSDIEPAQFSLTNEQKRRLLEQGYEQTMKFLEYKWGI